MEWKSLRQYMFRDFVIFWYFELLAVILLYLAGSSFIAFWDFSVIYSDFILFVLVALYLSNVPQMTLCIYIPYWCLYLIKTNKFWLSVSSVTREVFLVYYLRNKRTCLEAKPSHVLHHLHDEAAGQQPVVEEVRFRYWSRCSNTITITCLHYSSALNKSYLGKSTYIISIT